MGRQYSTYKIFGWEIDRELFFDAVTQFLDDKFEFENELIDMNYDDPDLWKRIAPPGVYVYMEGSYYEKSSSWNLYVSTIECFDDSTLTRAQKIKNLTPDQIKTAKEFAQQFTFENSNQKDLGEPKKYDLLVIF